MNNNLTILIISIILLSTLILILVLTRSHKRENYRKKDNDNTIFISLANYRDDDCKNTLAHIFENAKYPENIFVGVLSQYKENQESCELKSHPHAYNIRYMNVDESQAAGPLYARINIINNLYAGEKYFLMIDAHTRFKKDWDLIAMKQLDYLKNNGIDKPIISAYPATYDDFKNKPHRKDVPFICEIIDGDVIPKSLNAKFMKGNLFRRGYFIGAGCLFTYGKFVETIDLNPNLKHVFGGEELLFSILAYTHGWDIYGFAQNFLFHHYGHGKPNWLTDNHKQKDFKQYEEKSYDFLENLLTIDNFQTKYGLGSVRKLQDFWNEIGWKHNGSDFSKNWNKNNNNLLCDHTKIIPYK